MLFSVLLIIFITEPSPIKQLLMEATIDDSIQAKDRLKNKR